MNYLPFQLNQEPAFLINNNNNNNNKSNNFLLSLLCKTTTVKNYWEKYTCRNKGYRGKWPSRIVSDCLNYTKNKNRVILWYSLLGITCWLEYFLQVANNLDTVLVTGSDFVKNSQCDWFYFCRIYHVTGFIFAEYTTWLVLFLQNIPCDWFYFCRINHVTDFICAEYTMWLALFAHNMPCGNAFDLCWIYNVTGFHLFRIYHVTGYIFV